LYAPRTIATGVRNRSGGRVIDGTGLERGSIPANYCTFHYVTSRQQVSKHGSKRVFGTIGHQTDISFEAWVDLGERKDPNICASYDQNGMDQLIKMMSGEMQLNLSG
jgi:hypothetical protein